MLMDAVFGPGNFLNEVVWKRTSAHSSSKRYDPLTMFLFYYAKSRLTHGSAILTQTDKYKAKFGKTDPETGLVFPGPD